MLIWQECQRGFESSSFIVDCFKAVLAEGQMWNYWDVWTSWEIYMSVTLWDIEIISYRGLDVRDPLELKIQIQLIEQEHFDMHAKLCSQIQIQIQVTQIQIQLIEQELTLICTPSCAAPCKATGVPTITAFKTHLLSISWTIIILLNGAWLLDE